MKKMKYKLFKKIEAFALAGCMILSFSGCGDKTETQEKKVKVIDENGSKLVVIGFVDKQNGHVNEVEDYGYLTDNNGKITFSSIDGSNYNLFEGYLEYYDVYYMNCLNLRSLNFEEAILSNEVNYSQIMPNSLNVVRDEKGVCLRDDNYYSKGNLDPERYDLIKFDPSTYFSDSDEHDEKTTETTSFVKTK